MWKPIRVNTRKKQQLIFHRKCMLPLIIRQNSAVHGRRPRKLMRATGIFSTSVMTWSIQKMLRKTTILKSQHDTTNVNCGKRGMMMRKEIYTEKSPAAIGPYSQAIEAGDFIYVPGQIGITPETADVA